MEQRVVIVFCRRGEVPSELNLRNVTMRSQTQLESQFRLAFNMILNLLRQDAIKKSFSQNFVQQKAPGQKNQLTESTRRRRRMRPTGPTLRTRATSMAPLPHLTQD